jgi:pyrroloquinoline quinone (PQQ) biosynthesis protein C
MLSSEAPLAESTAGWTTAEPSLSGEAYVASLVRLAAEHRAVKHPLLAALQRAELPSPRRAVLDFVRQYLPYSQSFPRYLTAAISQLDSATHRQALLDNLSEESGRLDAGRLEAIRQAGIEPAWVDGIPHPVLLRRFLDAAGMTEKWLAENPSCDDAIVWSELFLQCCRSGAAQAVGALGVGTEVIVSTVYRPLLDAIRNSTEITSADYAFFALHCTVDDEHGDTLLGIASDFAERSHAERRALRLGALMALNLRASFYDAMLARAHAMPEERDARGL